MPSFRFAFALAALPLIVYACFPDFGETAASSGDGGADAAIDRTITDGNDGADASDRADAGDAAATTDGAPPHGMKHLAVDGGWFDHEPPAGDWVTEPWQTARLTRSFYMDETEVTVERFRAWRAAGQPVPCMTGTCTIDPGGPYEQTMVWSAAWNGLAKRTRYQSCGDTTFSMDAASNPRPMNCVNWYQAVAFCWWDGKKRLPTNTEWVYAATAGGDRRKYPWATNSRPAITPSSTSSRRTAGGPATS